MKKLVASLGIVLALTLGFYSSTSGINQTNVEAAGTAQNIIDTAKAQIGKPYVWGSAGPSSFDCSGLVHYVYSVKNGYGNVLGARTTAQNYWNKSIQKVYSNPVAGDLVFFYKAGTKSVVHVAIMISSTQFVEAPKPGANVKITNLKGYGLPVAGFERFVSISSTVPSSGPIQTVQTWLNQTYNSRLVVDGVAGSLTKQAIVKGVQTELNNTYNARLVVDGSFGALSKSSWRTLQYGSSGNRVKLIQARLITLGLPVTGGMDGSFGNGTKSAVQLFQKSKGLVQDGIVGPQTAQALFN
ncbi:peptidoglycan-binding protein [Listeria booriae]|uniref:peptidoglycan-binding protein n=1 Tax=Listeria booriae TaxID=1552123 RepID=UPI0028806F9F|nr:peptidoglycan-binding protein [Listeria booriae]MDT0109580.1 peptidoglycan-binding protein [Listeria booriae]